MTSPYIVSDLFPRAWDGNYIALLRSAHILLSLVTGGLKRVKYVVATCDKTTHAVHAHTCFISILLYYIQDITVCSSYILYSQATRN